MSLLVQGGYVVLAAFPAGDPYDAAAQLLAEHHRAAIVRFDPAQLDPVKAALVAAAPRNVALVMHPDQIDFAFARRFLQLATTIDDDPFVDFAFGYVTGATADEATALARRGTTRKPKARPRHGQLAGGEGEPDAAKLARELEALKGRDTITFIGHGYPGEVVGGPRAADLAGLVFDDAVVLNVACYTGVTHRWFEEDYQRGVLAVKVVPAADSFCLALLRTGVVGYTAYVCPRPAGPELDTDLAALERGGLSLGEARRRDYDKTVLGFLGFGEERMNLLSVAGGEKIEAGGDVVRTMMLEGATGGVLFGDPACVPFAPDIDHAPLDVRWEPAGDDLRLTAHADLRGLYLQCADPTAKWGNTMAMKVHARVPLGDRLVRDVVVDELRIGRDQQPSRVLWATETDQGERFVQLKINFPRGERMLGELRLVAHVATTKDPAAARERGGEVQRVAPRSTDLKSTVIQPFMLDRAAKREVSRETLQLALDASASFVGGDVPADAMAKLAAAKSEGFRAVCVLLECGHTHFRTVDLLRATWQPGDERHLIALASGPELPNYASWSVWRGLACADTPAVRKLLRDRFAAEEDAGIYMSVAGALAALGVHEVSQAIGDRVLEFRPGWVGVEPHLIDALGHLGDDKAIAALREIAGDPKCRNAAAAKAWLGRLDK
ncbi:MAG: hypothetical protein U1E73_01040 [Planctomycetota bacterium]